MDQKTSNWGAWYIIVEIRIWQFWDLTSDFWSPKGITLMCTQAVVISVWFCVSNILKNNKNIQMKLLSHNVNFNVFFKIVLNKSNEWKLIPKNISENIVTSVFKH